MCKFDFDNLSVSEINTLRFHIIQLKYNFVVSFLEDFRYKTRNNKLLKTNNSAKNGMRKIILTSGHSKTSSVTLVNNWIEDNFTISLDMYKQELDCAGMVFSVNAEQLTALFI